MLLCCTIVVHKARMLASRFASLKLTKIWSTHLKLIKHTDDDSGHSRELDSGCVQATEHVISLKIKKPLNVNFKANSYFIYQIYVSKFSRNFLKVLAHLIKLLNPSRMSCFVKSSRLSCD